MNRKPLILLICTLLWVGTSAQANDQGSGSGIVQEAMDVGSYVYVRLGTDGPWVAASSTPVSLGDKVEYTGGALMKNFYSARLDRTFEDILFAMNLRVINESGDPPAELPPGSTHDPVPPGHDEAVLVPKPTSGEIAPLEGGTTVSEILSAYPHPPGREASLRAKVMKFNPGIMGKNWVTLEDGTGHDGENKLIASTQEIVSAGETVVVTGMLANDTDLGYGYLYKVLLEDASFSR